MMKRTLHQRYQCEPQAIDGVISARAYLSLLIPNPKAIVPTITCARTLLRALASPYPVALMAHPPPCCAIARSPVPPPPPLPPHPPPRPAACVARGYLDPIAAPQLVRAVALLLCQPRLRSIDVLSRAVAGALSKGLARVRGGPRRIGIVH